MVTMLRSLSLIVLIGIFFLGLPAHALQNCRLSQSTSQRSASSCFRRKLPGGQLRHKSAVGGLCMKPISREDEIRRKINTLKKKGKIKKEPASATTATPLSSYEQKVKQKLGKRKSRLLGLSVEGDDDDDEVDRIQAELDAMDEFADDTNSVVTTERKGPQGRIGSIPELQQQREKESVVPTSSEPLAPEYSTPASVSGSSSAKKPLINPDLFDESEKEMEEEDLVDLVAKKLDEKRRLDAAAKIQAKLDAPSTSQPSVAESSTAPSTITGSASPSPASDATTTKKTTTGVGGSWTKPDNAAENEDLYKPKTGSWGVFPRPKSISKAYGGGRRVGAGYSKEDQAASELRTKQLLKDYRVKVGIEAPLEKEHAAEIEEALQLGQLAMQRGVYATAVSALEKVTKWCSTNSKVGSKVFLELAMAYEAVGRTQEAYQVYKTLSNCRMEDVKYNAKRLLYGLEAMEFMRDVSSDFSRKKIKSTFVDTTGLANIAQNFDDVYNTAYVDLDSGFYKRLTESVVRSNREARQILLKAAGKGEVPRLKVVQALRSIARHFDDALEEELASKVQVEPTALMDGKPIVASAASTVSGSSVGNALNLDEFVLASPEQMISNIEGKWRLQLLADKNGDGVSFYNTTMAVQEFCVEDMTYSASGRSGLSMVDQKGEISFDESKRILSRKGAKSGGGSGGFFGALFGGGDSSGFAGAVSHEQQIMSVDSNLLITKRPLVKKGSSNEKEHFTVWRRFVEVGAEP